uniref:Uncharacterized protein n=1 Tax=Medicago truncatula TaxID=3880 RepID=I3SRD0_MEDTR|nr:unknown [Medicago truncatula]
MYKILLSDGKKMQLLYLLQLDTSIKRIILGNELQTPNINGKNNTYHSHKLVSTNSSIIHELAYK